MPRPYPDRGRRRPGRRPPNRYPGGAGPDAARRRPHGFTGPFFGPAYDMFLPLRGRERRAYFNRAAVILGLAAGYAGLVQGYQWAGPIGAVFGLGCGLAAGCYFLEKKRFYRR